MSFLPNMTMGEPNMTTSDMETLIMSNNTQEMVYRATFWIEGVQSPLVSIAELAGMSNLNSGVVSKNIIPKIYPL